MPLFEEWVLPHASEEVEAPRFGVRSPIVATLLARAGVRTDEDFRRYTNPSITDLYDGSSIHGMDEACSRIGRAISSGEKIVIYGDYDVDGVTSIVLLKTVLRRLGAEVGWVVPHRIYDGYGLTIPVLERLLEEQKASLVITVDCGITSSEAVEHAISRGLDVIITDHHLPPEKLPTATVILNPRQQGCEYPFKDLAGVGVAFKLCCELLRRAGDSMSIESLTKIAALGTVADVAPLVDENRSIVRIGLGGLATSRNPGLKVLLRNLGILGRPLRSFDVGFKIGPRINAAGRISSADTAVRLFECGSEADAFPLVAELEQMNQRRKALQNQVLEEAERQIREQQSSPLAVVGGEGWHQGVVGLCAGRLAERLHRPVLAARIGTEECVGSGRSPEGIDLHAVLASVAHRMRRWGGHARACGFTVVRSEWEAFRREVVEAAANLTIPPRALQLTAPIAFEEIDPQFLRELALLEPWGEGNPEPRFVTSGVAVGSRREFAPGCWAIQLEHRGARHAAVVWPSKRELIDALAEGSTIDCAYSVEASSWDPAGVRLVLEDVR